MSKSPECPVHGVSARTAYQHRKCRCEVCRGFNTARQREWRRKNPGKQNEYNRKYYWQNREQILEEQKKLKYKIRRIERRHGLEAGQYEKLHEEQEGVCAICSEPETRERNGKPMLLVVDHCHTSGDVRWLLCHACNSMIGYAKENPVVLRKAADLLENQEYSTEVLDS